MKLNLFWIIYTIFFAILSISRLSLLLSAESPLRNYYIILLPFDIRYWAEYFLAILGAFFSLLSVFPLLFFTFKIDSKHKRLWKVALFFRILGDLFGRNYEWKLILSSYYLDPLAGISCLGMFVFPLIPSYTAHFHYLRSKSNPS